MKKFIVLVSTVALLIFSAKSTFACVCAKLGENFFDTVNQHNLKVKNGEFPPTEALTVFTGKVLNFDERPPGMLPRSMFVEVDQVLQGIVLEKRIWIDGDTDGMQCRPPIINFPINSTFILAINQDENNRKYLSVCGNYYLQTKSVAKTL